MAIVRGKNPEVDLKLKYRKVFWICTTISFVLHVATAVTFPTFDIAAAARKKDQIIIQMEDIPETQQIKRPPPPPRPAEPIETESEDVPDDVTIESTDIDFDEAFVDLPPPPPPGEAMEDEIMEFWKVEQKPVPIKTAPAVYPDIARQGGTRREGVRAVHRRHRRARAEREGPQRAGDLQKGRHRRGETVCVQACRPERQACAGSDGAADQFHASQVTSRRSCPGASGRVVAARESQWPFGLFDP